MKTSHQFARELLALPDLTIAHYDPSYAGIDDERDESLTEPTAAVETPDKVEGEPELPAFITINGAQDSKEEADELDAMRTALSRLGNPQDPEILKILGQPDFLCAQTARYLRKLGHEIPMRAPAIQAAVLQWQLGLYLEHGDKWRDAMAAEFAKVAPADLSKAAKPNAPAVNTGDPTATE